MFRSLFVPVVGLMNRLSYLKKFSLISLVYLIPLVGLAYLQLDGVFSDRRTTENQLQGLQQLRQAIVISRQAGEYRDLRIVAGSGLQNSDPLAVRIGEARKALQSTLATLGQSSLSEDAQQQRLAIQALVDQPLQGVMTDQEARFQRSNLVVRDSWNLLRQISDDASLSGIVTAIILH